MTRWIALPWRSGFRAFAALLLLGVVDAATAQDGRFGAWDVACSARVYCVAAASGISVDGAVTVFKLERGPAPDSKVFVTTGPSEPLSLGMRVDIDIQGLPEPYGVYGEVQRIYDGNEMTFAGGARRELVANLRRGMVADVSVAFGGEISTITYHVPLSGLTLALLEIDRRQGRLDRADAMVAWGGQPVPPPQVATADGSAPSPASVDAGASPPGADAGAPVADDSAAAPSDITTYQIVYAPGELPVEVVRKGEEELSCALGEAVEMFGAQAVRFANGEALFIVPCHPADANVETFVALQGADTGPVQVLAFADQAGASQPLITNPEFDEASNRITAHGYYSPDYDCGHYSAWAVDTATGNATLEESRAKPDCDGEVVAPADWPLVR